MNKVLIFVSGLIVGAGAGTTTTYFVVKKKYDNKFDEAVTKEIETVRSSAAKALSDVKQNQNEKAEEEDVIPDLAEMANKVKKEESEKTDYTGYSKSEVKEKPKKPIKYTDLDDADKISEEGKYAWVELDYYQNGVLVYEDGTQVQPETLDLDKSKLIGDDVYAVDYSKHTIYEININDMTYDEYEDEYDDEEEEANESNGEQTES